MMMKKICSLSQVASVVIAVLALQLTTTAATFAESAEPAAEAVEIGSPAAHSAEKTIETFQAGLLDIMKHAEELGMEGRIEKLAPLMDKTFDLRFMASKSVGRHWRSLSDEEKSRWVDLFKRFTTANYAGRFTGFKGEKFVTVGTKTRRVVPGW